MPSTVDGALSPEEIAAAREREKDTYRYLRGGMVVMIVMLVTSVLLYSAMHRCVATSLSAYYYTPVRPIFIAALCALGIMLIAYRGTKDSEDSLLDLAGVMAFLIAVMPTRAPDKGCPNTLPIPKDVLDASAHNNVAAVLVGLVFAKVSAVLMNKWKGTTRPLSDGGKWARIVFWACIVVGTIAYTARNEWFLRDGNGHTSAAITLFVALAVVIFMNALMATQKHDEAKPYPAIYTVIGALMVLGVVWLGGLFLFDKTNGESDWPYWTLVVEAGLIGLFAAFWVTQTIELWNATDRTKDLVQQAPATETDSLSCKAVRML